MKKRYLILIIVCLFAISAVSANEITTEANDMLLVDSDLLINEEINVQQEDILATSYDEEVICETNGEGYNGSGGDAGDDLIDPSIDFNANDIIVGETLEIKVFLPVDATGNVTVIMHNETYLSSVNDGLAVVLIDGLPSGVNQKFTICYGGDDRYFSSHVNSSIDVYPIEDYEITVSSPTITFGEIAEIVVKVPLDAKGIVVLSANTGLKTVKYESQVVNGEATFEISDFAIPNTYGFYAALTKDPKYGYKEAEGTIKVKPIYNYSMVADDVDVYVNESACLVVKLPDDAEGDVYFTIGNQKEYVQIYNGTAKMNVSNFKAGNYTFTADYETYDDFGGCYYSKYASKTVTGVLRVHRIPINAIDFYTTEEIVGESFKIMAFLPADATGNVTVAIYNKTYSSGVNENGQAVVEIDMAPVGVNQNCVIYYSGDNKYLPYHFNSSIDIFPIEDYEITASSPTITFGETAEIVVKVPLDAKGIVVLSANTGLKTVKYESQVVNGEATFEISDFAIPNTYGFYAALTKDPKYGYKEAEGTIKVKPIYNYSMVADDVDVYVNESACLVVKLPDDAEGDVYFTIGNQKEYVQIYNGTAKMNVSNFKAGNYTFTAYYATYDDFGGCYYSKYVDKTVTGVLRVHKISNYEMNISDIYIEKGEIAKIIVNLPSDATGTAKVRIFNDYYDSTYAATVQDGQIIVNEKDLTKDSKFTVDYLGNDKYESKSVSGSIFVKRDIIINASDLTKYYHGSERFVVTVKEDNKAVVGKNVTINLNGVTYARTTDSNGDASMAINLNSGVYNVTSEFEGIEVESTITVKSTVSGENITKMFRNATQYYATFVDASGKALAENTPVEFNINGVFYTRYTNNKGVARMNINLNPGEYVITAKNPNSTEQYTNIITVLPTIVEVHDLTKYYKNASKLTFRLLDDQGRPVGAGVSANININGVLYTRQTDASGYINMNINLGQGTYIATLEYNGLMASSTVKVLPILSAKDISLKYRDGTKFEAKLIDGQGNPFAGQSITFNINGVLYNRPTDENGIARLAINLMPGEYIITSMYEPNGAAISNTVTVRS